MSIIQHPFTEDEPPHTGWRVYRFKVRNNDWQLTTIEDGGPSYSILSIKENPRAPYNDEYYWPLHKIFKLDDVVSVETCVVFINNIYGAFAVGKERGRVEAQHEVRKALGIQ